MTLPLDNFMAIDVAETTLLFLWNVNKRGVGRRIQAFEIERRERL